LNFANDAGELGPQSRPTPFDSSAFAGGRYVLTGKSSRYHVNESIPRVPVERLNVIPHGETVQVPFRLSLKKAGHTEGIMLNSADGAPTKQLSSQDAASCPCK
jgi:hypothetical protein